MIKEYEDIQKDLDQEESRIDQAVESSKDLDENDF